MTTFNATQARIRLYDLIKSTNKAHDVIRITHKSGNAVLLSEEDFESIVETLELKATPGFIKRINKAKKEIKNGETISFNDAFKN